MADMSAPFIVFVAVTAATQPQLAPPVPPPIPHPNTPPPVLPRELFPVAPPAPPLPGRPPVLLNPDKLVRPKDYPPSAIRAGAQGAVRFTASVSRQGKPTACWITESSGNAELDAATCRLVWKRAKFRPSEDLQGKRRNGLLSRRIVWRLP